MPTYQFFTLPDIELPFLASVLNIEFPQAQVVEVASSNDCLRITFEHPSEDGVVGALGELNRKRQDLGIFLTEKIESD